MKKILLFAGYLQVGLLAVLAQPNTSADLPPGPLIKPEMPEFSSWVINSTYSDPAERVTARQQEYQKSLAKMAESDPSMAKFLGGNATAAAPRPRVSQILTVKTGDIRQETTTFEGGKRAELWETQGLRMRKDPFSGKILLETGAERPEGLGDFPEFSWISKENFRESKSLKGRVCLMFEAKVLRSILEDPKNAWRAKAEDFSEDAYVAATAAIDSETRLPALLQWEDQVRTYELRPSPTQKLVVPEEFLRVYNQSVNRARAATAPLSPR